MKLILILLYFLVLISFFSCDSFKHAQGFIIDKTTGNPLVNVNIYNRPTSNKYEYILAHTDSTGYFKFGYTTGGIFGGPREFWIKEDGYQHTKVKYNYSNDTIRVELEK